jgi:TonB family protein
MNISNGSAARRNRSMHRPAIAALLSLFVPGLGQIFNQSRKGLLFFGVGLMNLVLVCSVFFTEPIVEGLRLIAQSTDSKLNDSILTFLSQLHLSLPTCLLIGGSTVAFIGFTAIDAYNGASLKRRHVPESTAVMALSEAISASYILHIAAALALCLFCSFLVNPEKPKEDKAVCEFVLQTQDEVNKEKTNIMSLKSSKAHGKFDRTKEISNTHASVASVESTPEQQQQRRQAVKPVQQQQRRQAVKPVQQQQAVQPRQAVTPQQAVEPQRAEPKTKDTPEKDREKLRENSPVKQVVEKKKTQPKKSVQPKRAVQPRQAVRAVQARQAVQQRQAVHQTQAVSRRSRQASRRSPDMPGKAFNLDRDVDSNSAAVASNADVNFAPYMNQLQRRMKRNWSPPGGASRRAVTVWFRIFSDGRIANIRLARSSGSGACDRAALDAVGASSPFLPLPNGASGPVNVEFTFDYSSSIPRATSR